jgi:hypothetical protein
MMSIVYDEYNVDLREREREEGGSEWGERRRGG